MSRPRLPLLAAATALVLALACSAASAQEFIEVEPGGSFRASSAGKLTFSASELTLSCNVTLTGTLETAFIDDLQTEAELGSVSSTSFANCTGGTFERALALPWEMNYTRTVGTLPEAATAILLTIHEVSLGFSTFFEFIRCLYKGDLGASLSLSGTNPYRARTFRLLSTELALVSGAGCPARGSTAGTLLLNAEQNVLANPLKVFVSPDGWTFPRRAGAENKTFEIVDIEAAPVTINRLVLWRPAGTAFEIPAANDRCTGVTLRPETRNRCQVDIHYAGGATKGNMLLVREGALVVGGVQVIAK